MCQPTKKWQWLRTISVTAIASARKNWATNHAGDHYTGCNWQSVDLIPFSQPGPVVIGIDALDADRDGYGTEAFAVTACAAPSEDYVAEAGDCDDGTAGVNPGAQEFCSGRDDDCDGKVDYDDDDVEGLKVWYLNQDGDGFDPPGIPDWLVAPPESE